MRIIPFAALSILIAVTACSNIAMGYTPEPNLLEIKGYSPELVSTTQIQRSRQEWRTPPPPKMTPFKRFLHNVYNNNYTGNLDAFGSGIIRED